MKGSHLMAVGTLATAASVTEVQTITPSTVPISGNYKLNFDGDVTADIAFGASAGTIQTAVRTLTGLSGATVSGTLATAVVVTMAGYSGNAPLLTVSDNTLEDATDPVDLDIDETTPGVALKTLDETDYTELDLTTPEGDSISGNLMPAHISFVQFVNLNSEKMLLGVSDGVSSFADCCVEANPGVEVVISANQKVALKTSKATAITTGTYKVYFFG